MTNEFETLMNQRGAIKPLATRKSFTSIVDDEVGELTENKKDLVKLLGIKAPKSAKKKRSLTVYLSEDNIEKLEKLYKNHGFKNQSSFLDELLNQM